MDDLWNRRVLYATGSNLGYIILGVSKKLFFYHCDLNESLSKLFGYSPAVDRTVIVYRSKQTYQIATIARKCFVEQGLSRHINFGVVRRKIYNS